MIVLVAGGASSGKSAVSEGIALSLSGPHWYVATMRRGGAEVETRIARHVDARAGKGFTTVELSEPAACSFGPQGTALLEDLPNLLLNGLTADLDRLLACDNVVIVTGEIGCDGVRYDGYTREFIGRLGALSCEIARRADLVVEVVAGIPFAVKASQAAEPLLHAALLQHSTAS